MSAERHAEIRALLVLDQLPGVGPVTIKNVVDRTGSAVEALRGRRQALTWLAGAGMLAMARNPSLAARAERALADADRLGMRVLTWTDPEYPVALHHLHDPPSVLFLRGRVELLGTRGVTVVGARRASVRARDISRRLGRALARAGCPVISGMALGVDGAAHVGALDVDGDTIAVLGRGADAAYPPAHHGLFQQILSKGLVVSEFMPGVAPLAHHFPRRNRILAALSRAVVMVEAGATSGSKITADHALDLGIDVHVVPGPIDEPACAGSNAWLRQGASALISIEAFVQHITGLDLLEPVAAGGRVPDRAEFGVLKVLGDGCHDPGEIAARAGLPLPKALAMLAALEVRGWVEQLPGMRFRRAG